jgi:hypothetical protein
MRQLPLFSAGPEAGRQDRRTRCDSQANQQGANLRGWRKSFGAPQRFAGLVRNSCRREFLAFNQGKRSLSLAQSFRK